MAVLNFIIAIVALVVAILAYQRSGWAVDARKETDTPGTMADCLREKTANALSRVEKAVRKDEEKGAAVEESGEKTDL